MGFLPLQPIFHNNSVKCFENSEHLGPPQTRPIVNDNYLVVDHKKLSITKKPVCEASCR